MPRLSRPGQSRGQSIVDCFGRPVPALFLDRGGRDSKNGLGQPLYKVKIQNSHRRFIVAPIKSMHIQHATSPPSPVTATGSSGRRLLPAVGEVAIRRITRPAAKIRLLKRFLADETQEPKFQTSPSLILEFSS